MSNLVRKVHGLRVWACDRKTFYAPPPNPLKTSVKEIK